MSFVWKMDRNKWLDSLSSRITKRDSGIAWSMQQTQLSWTKRKCWLKSQDAATLPPSVEECLDSSSTQDLMVPEDCKGSRRMWTALASVILVASWQQTFVSTEHLLSFNSMYIAASRKWDDWWNKVWILHEPNDRIAWPSWRNYFVSSNSPVRTIPKLNILPAKFVGGTWAWMRCSSFPAMKIMKLFWIPSLNVPK